MKRKLAAFFVTSALLGCASTPPIAELREGTQSATFIQHGSEPRSYAFGVVDGKTFWANASSQNLPSAGVLGVSDAAYFAIKHGTDIASSTAKSSHEIEAEMMAAAFRRVMDGKIFAARVTQQVMPSLAKAWGVGYAPDRLRVFPVPSPVATDKGRFTLPDPHTDIVIVFGIDQIELTETLSMGGLLSGLVTLGFNDKNVAPNVTARMTAFKRDRGTGLLQRVWEKTCLGPVLLMPKSEKFSALMNSSTKAKPVFEGAIGVTAESCQRILEKS